MFRWKNKIIVAFAAAIILGGLISTEVQAKTDQAQAAPSPPPTFTPTATVGVINDFAVKAEINTDSSVDITETIVYNFGDFDRHGIYRTIPVKYQIERAAAGEEVSENLTVAKALGNKYNLRLTDISVTDQSGVAYQFETSREGRYLKIKVGDSDVFVSGEKTYVIKYKVWRALGFFSDHDELYWNVTGHEWKEPMLKASLQVILPPDFAQKHPLDPKNSQTWATAGLKQACYTGPYGSDQQFCLAEVTAQNQVDFNLEAGRPLDSGEGLTAVLSFPKGLIQPVSKKQELIWILTDNLGTLYAFITPLIVFVLLFIHWFRRGRDPEGKGTIIAQYGPPDNLTPQEVGTVVDERVDNVDLSSLLISLAVKGYLKIKELPGKKILGISASKDFLFTKLKSDYSGLENYEKTFLEAIFDEGDEKQLSELKNTFYTNISTLQQELYEAVMTRRYFSKNPNTVRKTYIATGIIVAMMGAIFSAAVFGSGLAAVANAAIGVMIAIFGYFMPRKTAKGTRAKEHILGLKEYLSVAEADRLKFHNAPAKKPETFEKLLPYAMVLGVEKEWAQQFKDIYNQPPGWYEGSDLNAFNSIYLANSLGRLQNNANAAFVSRPGGTSGSSGFSGGGSSGGGFGGGGGGSW